MMADRNPRNRKTIRHRHHDRRPDTLASTFTVNAHCTQKEEIDQIWTQFEDVDSTPCVASPTSPMCLQEANTEKTVKKCLHEVTSSASAFKFGPAAVLFSNNHTKVSEFVKRLHQRIESVQVKGPRVTGIAVQQAQAKFYKYLCSGAEDLNELTGDYHLTMWLCTRALDVFSGKGDVQVSTSGVCPDLSEVELDVAHYVGGFVCSKLKQRNFSSDYIEVIDSLVSSMDPSEQTLLAAKSRGRLTNLTSDGKCLFVALEQIFRTKYPGSVTSINQSDFLQKCLGDQVVQNCFHSSTDKLTSERKDQAFVDLITLFFRVRVHQKCKIIIENVQRKKVDAKKAKSLRSKLAK